VLEPFPFPLPGSARAADTPSPAIKRPAIATTLAAFSFHPVMQVLSFPWLGRRSAHKRGERFPL
jgi:hypothetical protein